MRMGRGDSGLSIATNNNNTAMQQLHGGGGPPLTPTGKSMRKIDITTSDKFPAGLRVLAVDDDPTCLKILATTLRKCSYEVTTCTRAAEALSLLRENKDNFDLVISDVYMPDMDGFKLLECVGLEMDLPVIMTSSHGETSAVMKGITHGACDYLLKPVRIEELRNIWQHVVRKKRNENSSKDFDTSGSVEDSEKQRRGSDEGDYTSSVNDGLDGNWKLSKRRKDDDDNDHDNEDPSTLKKQRVVWSVELHQQFVNAVNHLGIDKAVPKKILELMNVPGLTRENVASHLQKYRLYLRRLSGVQSQTSANSPFCGTADAYGSICPLDGLTDIRTLAATGQLSQQTLATFQGGLLGRVGGSQQGGGSIVGSLDPSVMMQIPAGGYYGRPSHQQQQPQQPQQQQQQQPQIVTTPSLLSLEHSSSQTLQQLSPVAQTLQQLSPVAVDDVVDVYSGGHGSSSTNTLMMQMQQRQQQQMDPLIGSNMCTASNGRVGYLGGSDKVLANVSGEASFPSNTGFTRTTIGTDNKRNSSSSRNNNNNSNIPYGSSSNEVVDPAMLLDGFKDMTSSILSTRGFMANLSLQHLSGNENVLSGFGIGNSVPSLPARFSLDNNNSSANNNSNSRPYGDQCLTAADNNFNVKLESSGNTDDLLSIVLKQQQHEGMSFDSDYVMM